LTQLISIIISSIISIKINTFFFIPLPICAINLYYNVRLIGEKQMPEVILNGPQGRIECRYHPGSSSDSPVALILHPEPNQGGSMNNRVSYGMYHEFRNRGFSVLRFNFRGVGRSEGVYEGGEGELADAAAVLDWLQSQNLHSRYTFIAGFSFGSWVGMQLMMRRPEIVGFISVSPPADKFDFSFLAPCPASGLIIHGENNKRVPHETIQKLIDRLSIQKGIKIDVEFIKEANHMFSNHNDELINSIKKYLNSVLEPSEYKEL
jgi:alpha/beta superfamily hydrolase